MKRGQLVSLPPWARYWLLGLGIAWIVAGWLGVGGGAFWLIFWFLVIVGMAFAGVWIGRRYANVTLEPWSKERGIVIWGYRRSDTPSSSPRLVWDDASPTAPEAPPPTASVVPPTAPEATPAAIAANERLQSRPLPFPPHPASTAAAEVAAAAVPKDTGRKICPDCAETVLSEARVCRYCGYRFDQSPDPQTHLPAP